MKLDRLSNVPIHSTIKILSTGKEFEFHHIEDDINYICYDDDENERKFTADTQVEVVREGPPTEGQG